MTKTILITGCAGFIGSHLTDFFLQKKNKVIGLDNLITGSLKNISHNFDNPDFSFHNLNVSDDFDFDCKISTILHFASPASPKEYLKHPIETLRCGSVAAQNLLKIAMKKKSTILFASTSEVYGDPLVHPQNENYFGNVNPIGPRSVYDESKRFQESIASLYQREYGVNVRIARIFNTYGPRMKVNDGRAIPNFINQAINNIPLTVYGNGSQTRSFCYIDDLVEGIYKLLNSNYIKPINLGNPDEITLRDLANEIIILSNSKCGVEYKDLPIDDPKKRRPDISNAIKYLDWKPKISREIGLKKTFDYFQELI